MALTTGQIVAIAAVAVIAVSGAGVGIAYGMGAFNHEEIADASSMAKKVSDNYNGVFGKFSVEEGATKEKAVLNSVVEKYHNDKGQQQVNRFTIWAFDSKEDAEKKYTELLESFPETAGMYTIIETLELTSDNGASDYNCDKGRIMFTSYNKEGIPTTAASQSMCLILHGKYVLDLSQQIKKGESAGENVRLYYGLPITDIYEEGQQVSLDTMKTNVKDFLKTF